MELGVERAYCVTAVTVPCEILPITFHSLDADFIVVRVLPGLLSL